MKGYHFAPNIKTEQSCLITANNIFQGIPFHLCTCTTINQHFGNSYRDKKLIVCKGTKNDADKDILDLKVKSDAGKDWRRVRCSPPPKV